MHFTVQEEQPTEQDWQHTGHAEPQPHAEEQLSGADVQQHAEPQPEAQQHAEPQPEGQGMH